MRYVSHTDGYCGNGFGFVPLMPKIPVSEIPYIFNEDSAYRWHR